MVEFCRGYIEQNYCVTCAKKLYGIIPDDGVCDAVFEDEDGLVSLVYV